MQSIFTLIVNFYQSIFRLLHSVELRWNAIAVPLDSLLFAFIAIGIVITIFWKGGRT